MRLVQKIQVCPSSCHRWNLCSQKLSVACRQIFLWQACISMNFHMVMFWGHLQSTKADARNGVEFRGTTQCHPTGSCCMELKHKVQRKRMVKVIFGSIGMKFLEVTTGKFVLRVNWDFGTTMSCLRCFIRLCEELKCTWILQKLSHLEYCLYGFFCSWMFDTPLNVRITEEYPPKEVPQSFLEGTWQTAQSVCPKAENANPVGEVICLEFLSLLHLVWNEVSRKTCFDSSDFRPSPLGTNWSVRKKRRFLYTKHFLSFVFLY